METEQVAAIVSDPRLTPTAARVVLYVALKGEGVHDVKGVELEIIVGGGEKPIRAAIERAVFCGYLDASHAGRAGHRLLFHMPEMTPRREELENGITPQGEEFPENHSPRGGISPTVVSSTLDSTVKPPVVPLSAETLAVIEKHGTLLKGCRGALTDYLLARVRPASRTAYVHTLVCYLNLSTPNVFRLPRGGLSPPETRTAVVAAAMNELLQGDERGGEKPMKWPNGDVRNLRTKIEMLLKQGDWNERRNGDKEHGGRPAGKGRESADEKLLRHRKELEQVDLSASKVGFK